MTVIVTGVSGGIGKAIVDHYLKEGKQVIGIGRKNSTNHANYRFIQCDLNDSEQIQNIQLSILSGSVLLVNNAGVLGQIGRLSENNQADIAQVLQVNVVAAIELTKKVYASLMDQNQFTLVNISSGAALRPIPSWLAYCSSKAAMNMFSMCFYEEEKQRGNKLRVYSVSPGVVDTKMQGQIRESTTEEFSEAQRFKDLKANDELWPPEEVASRLALLLEKPFGGEVVCDLRSV